MIIENETLTLNNNKKFIVVAQTIYKKERYLFLIEEDNYTNIIFCKDENNELIKVTDSNLIKILINLFNEKLSLKIK